MEKLTKQFDDFTWQARAMPVIVVSIPIFLAALAKGFAFSGWVETGFMTVLLIASISLLYRLARDMGKRCEIRMIERLGAMPTVIMLRFSDHTIGEVSKRKYHQRINEVYQLTLPLEPSAETLESDEQYDAALRSLKNRANSDREKEFRVYQQLKEYHFYRNLYGIKPVAIVIYVVLTFRELWLIPGFNAEGLFLHPFPNYITLYIFLLGILLICFVTRKGVEERSYSYGKALLESCERL